MTRPIIKDIKGALQEKHRQMIKSGHSRLLDVKRAERKRIESYLAELVRGREGKTLAVADKFTLKWVDGVGLMKSTLTDETSVHEGFKVWRSRDVYEMYNDANAAVGYPTDLGSETMAAAE